MSHITYCVRCQKKVINIMKVPDNSLHYNCEVIIRQQKLILP